MYAVFCLSSHDSSSNPVNKTWLRGWGFRDAETQQVLYQDAYLDKENKSKHHCLHWKMNEDISENPEEVKKGEKRRGRQRKKETLRPGLPQSCGPQAFFICTAPSWTLLSGVCGWQSNTPKPNKAENYCRDLGLSIFKGY